MPQRIATMLAEPGVSCQARCDAISSAMAKSEPSPMAKSIGNDERAGAIRERQMRHGKDEIIEAMALCGGVLVLLAVDNDVILTSDPDDIVRLARAAEVQVEVVEV